jgi:hypothetical protein
MRALPRARWQFDPPWRSQVVYGRLSRLRVGERSRCARLRVNYFWLAIVLHAWHLYVATNRQRRSSESCPKSGDVPKSPFSQSAARRHRQARFPKRAIGAGRSPHLHNAHAALVAPRPVMKLNFS